VAENPERLTTRAAVSTDPRVALASPGLNVITGAPRRARVIDVVVGSLVALIGTVLFVFATRGGLGFSPDSVVYTDAARSIASGHGYTRLVGETGREAIGAFPPLYSAALAAFDVVGLEVATGARVLNGLLFVGTGILLYVLLLRLTGGSRVVATLGAGAFVLAEEIVALQGALVSESLFLFLVVVFFLTLDAYLLRASRPLLVALGLVAALAALTRYVGIALVLSGAATLLLVGAGDRGRRARAAALFGAVALTPQVAWFVRNQVSDARSHQRFDVHPVRAEQVENGLGVVSDWFFPAPIPAALRILLFSLLAVTGLVALLKLIRRARSSSWRGLTAAQSRVITAIVLFAASYVLVMVLSISFVDADVEFSARHLTPLFVAVVVVVPVAALRATQRQRLPRRVLGAWFLGVLFLFAYQTTDQIVSEPVREAGLTARGFSESGLMETAARTPATRTIYSNVPEAIYLNTGRRNAKTIPFEFDPNTREANPNFEAEVRAMGAEIAAGRAVLLWWNARENRTFLPTTDELELLLPELRRSSADGGEVFTVARPTG
jgi:hypothetical protein